MAHGFQSALSGSRFYQASGFAGGYDFHLAETRFQFIFNDFDVKYCIQKGTSRNSITGSIIKFNCLGANKYSYLRFRFKPNFGGLT